MRDSPNLVVTGTPGVGKTTHCELLAQRTGLRHLCINQVVKDRECHEGWDDELSCWIVDEDKVRQPKLEGAVLGGGRGERGFFLLFFLLPANKGNSYSTPSKTRSRLGAASSIGTPATSSRAPGSI